MVIALIMVLDFLSQIKTFYAHFYQIEDEDTIYGVIYSKRPDKLRIDIHYPQRQILIFNRNDFCQIIGEDTIISESPLEENPVEYFLSSWEFAKVMKIGKRKYRITMPDEYQFVMQFDVKKSKGIPEIKEIITEEEIIYKFKDVRYNENLKENLFKIKFKG